jgi:hypothetical protein
MDNRIKLLEKLKIQLNGHLYVGDEEREGWKRSAPFYLFKCPKHGYVKNYIKGFDKRLDCPECLKELHESKARARAL